ncbi:hypothetical protein GCM10027186_59830 [Micromonospora schwarzwaldensis]
MVERTAWRICSGIGWFSVFSKRKVAQVVGAAPLPARARKGGADRGDEAAVGVGDDQLDAGQPAGRQ